MKRERQKRFFLIALSSLALLGMLVVARLTFFSPKIKKDAPLLLSFLLVEKNAAAVINSAALLFSYYPKNYFYLFELKLDARLRSGGREETIREALQDLTQGREKIAALLGLSLSHTVLFSEEKLLTVLEKIGGIRFFNLHSKALNKGEVFIDTLNYQSFMKAIENPYERRDVFLSFWLGVLKQLFARAKQFRKIEWSNLEVLYQALETELNWATFKRLSRPLLEKELANTLFIKRASMNVRAKQNKGATVYYPLQEGEYDKNKLRTELARLVLQPRKSFPIEIQVRNTTRISRLAVKTAGVLRRRGINVKEYLNSKINLEKSTILNFAHSPLKSQRLQAATKVSNAYSLFDHRREFDFSLYLSKDYYAIPFITNQ